MADTARDIWWLVDMTGRVLTGGARIIRRAPNVNGNARWVVKMPDCGHEFAVEGIALRAGEKSGRTLRCRVCPKKRAVKP